LSVSGKLTVEASSDVDADGESEGVGSPDVGLALGDGDGEALADGEVTGGVGVREGVADGDDLARCDGVGEAPVWPAGIGPFVIGTGGSPPRLGVGVGAVVERVVPAVGVALVTTGVCGGAAGLAPVGTVPSSMPPRPPASAK
jgi:hypothetical protein